MAGDFATRVLMAAVAALLVLRADMGLAAAAPAQNVDLQLVLAVDISGSINYSESELQRKGFAEAFQSKEVVQAIQSGTLGRIGVAVVFFSSEVYGVMSVPINWTILSDQKSAAAFAQAILSVPRQTGRGTSVSEGLDLALRTLIASPLRSPKSVIDVSGDGYNNAGGPMLEARDRVLANGVTINGLPIITDRPDLDHYFRSCVIGGPGSFVIPATDFADFSRAIRRKLVLEISGLTPEQQPDTPRVMKAAAAPQNPLLLPRANAPTPYPGGCDFIRYGGQFFR